MYLWGTGNELSQAELIKRAFAGDDVHAEFDAAKAAEIEEELPKEVRSFQTSLHCVEFTVTDGMCLCSKHLMTSCDMQYP